MEEISSEPELSVLWKDSIWDRLLDSLETTTVIPVVGPDLITVEIDGTDVPVERYLAEQLATMNRLSVPEYPAERTLNFVVCKLLRTHRDRYAICDDIFQIMKSRTLTPGKSLRKLAEISAFRLFVTTSFTPLLEQALVELNTNATAISYSPKRVEDLSCAVEKLTRPTVYYLMGKLSATGNYVLSDEDLLERICDLQTASRRPDRLFDELKRSHLLVLGEAFSDWLARLFLRIAKGGRLSAMRESIEILADNRSQADRGLVTFLENFSSHTRVFRSGGAVEFIDELHQRWLERHPLGSSHSQTIPDDDADQAGGVFLSYAREDADYARELRSGLEAAGIKVWFDQDSLRSGDSFHPRIEQCISRDCKCFIAIVSRTTEQRHEGYFRREWNLAVDRDKGIHHTKRFILPVVVDNTLEPMAVPKRFSDLNYTWLPGGRVTPVFVRDVKAITQS
jgi:hypothetical protein